MIREGSHAWFWRSACFDLNMSMIQSIDSADPKGHSSNMQQALQELTNHVREDLDKVQEPRFQALLETSAEVLTGLQTAFADYSEGREKVWRR